MANVLHSSLTGAELHEPKGISAASQDTVYVADGSGSGTWGEQHTFCHTLTNLSYTISTFNASTQYSPLYNMAKLPWNCTVDAISLEGSTYVQLSTISLGFLIYNSTGNLHYQHAVTQGPGTNSHFFYVKDGSVLNRDVVANTNTYLRMYVGPSPGLAGTRTVTLTNLTVYFRQRN